MQPPNKSLVDIVVPIYNHPELVEECIGALESTTAVPFNLILVNDASPDPAMRPYLEKQTKRARVERNYQNAGFAATCNKGVRVGNAKYVVLLNSDTVPLPGWLDMMVEDVEAHPDHGVVGACLLFHPETHQGPGGTVQHAGMSFDVMRRPSHRYIGWPSSNSKVREYRDDLQAVTGACMLVRRTVWNHVGGFATEYGRGCFEDVELCLKARFYGSKIVYQPNAMLYHRVGGSAEDIGGFPLNANWQLFKRRIGGLVEFDAWRVL